MKLIALIIAILIPSSALYLGLQISPSIGNILLSPISFLSSFFNDIFINIPYQVKALLIFTSAIFYFLIFYFFTKLFFKKLAN